MTISTIFFTLPLLSTLTTSFPTANGPNPDPSTATIAAGPLLGVPTIHPDAPYNPINKYLGIPFADPPTRFSPPNPLSQNWTDPFNASEYGPACYQQFSYPKEQRDLTVAWFNTPPVEEDEDCLTVNVFAPAWEAEKGGVLGEGEVVGEGEDEGKAVMVWFYGGGLRYGHASTGYYDGTFLAAREGVVVVSFNYRTNIFGFPSNPTLPHGTANPGFLDQRLALDWIQNNIASFGGSPHRVTIFGESAGASSIDALLTQPPNPLPFRSAILQSGQTSIRTRAPTTPGESWDKACEAFNCSATDIECMRNVPAAELKDTIEKLALGFGPVADNETLASAPRMNRQNSSDEGDGTLARVPVLIGTNADESRLFAKIGGLDKGGLTLAAFINASFPKVLQQTLLDVYGDLPGNDFDKISTILTDSTFLCPATSWSRDSVEAGVPTYRYLYNASFPNTELFEGAGVFHSSEILSVFGTWPREGATEWQEEVGRGMMDVWGRWARRVDWGTGWGEAPGVGVLGGGVRADGGEGVDGWFVEVVDEKAVDEGRCALWEIVYGSLGG